MTNANTSSILIGELDRLIELDAQIATELINLADRIAALKSEHPHGFLKTVAARTGWSKSRISKLVNIGLSASTLGDYTEHMPNSEETLYVLAKFIGPDSEQSRKDLKMLIAEQVVSKSTTRKELKQALAYLSGDIITIDRQVLKSSDKKKKRDNELPPLTNLSTCDRSNAVDARKRICEALSELAIAELVRLGVDDPAEVFGVQSFKVDIAKPLRLKLVS